MTAGDIVFLNDPYEGGTHLPDVTLVSPVFGTEVAKPGLVSPVCGVNCPTRRATVRIRLRRTGRVTVLIVDSAGHKVAIT